VRVLVVNWTSSFVGGAERVADWTLKALRDAGLEVAFCSEEGGEGHLGADFEHVSPSRVRSWKPTVVLSHGIVAPKFEEELARRYAFAVDVHSYHGMCVSGTKLHSLPPVMVCERALGPSCLVRYLPRGCGGRHPLTMLRDFRRQTWRRQTLRSADLVIVHSKHMQRVCESNGVEAVLERIPFEAPPEPQPVPSEPRVTFVGRLAWNKGGEVLLAAWQVVSRQRPEVVLHVAGTGPDESRWRHLARELPSVRFEGQLDSLRRDELLRSSSVVVTPSIWPEPFGMVGLEAARFAVPCVASNVGGVADWLEDGVSGVLVEPGVASSLADGILAALELGRQQNLRRGAEDRYRCWQSRQLTGARLVQLLESAIARSAR
jgi:glycosyltransferase involved in cell wall biosynthesis